MYDLVKVEIVEKLEKVKDILTNLFEERSPKDDHFMRTDQMVLKYSYVPLPDGSHLISFVDISDSWRFEKALRERNEALEQSENLRTEFLSHVAYELRSPVNSVIGFSEILLNQYFGSLNERQEEYCQSIFKSSQRLMLLINDAVDLMALETKQFALSRASIDLDQFIQSTLSLLHNRAYDQGIDIHVDIRTKTKQFTADDRRLKQALFHLLTNSLRYTPTGGAIKLTVDTFNKNVKQASQIFIMFRIDDTGIGVTKEKMKEIKLLLKSKKNTQKQAISGLGLPLVKRLIEMHGGTFTLDSSENKGCTAICSIPLLKESPSMYEKRMPKTDTQQSINDVISS